MSRGKYFIAWGTILVAVSAPTTPARGEDEPGHCIVEKVALNNSILASKNVTDNQEILHGLYGELWEILADAFSEYDIWPEELDEAAQKLVNAGTNIASARSFLHAARTSHNGGIGAMNVQSYEVAHGWWQFVRDALGDADGSSGECADYSNAQTEGDLLEFEDLVEQMNLMLDELFIENYPEEEPEE